VAQLEQAQAGDQSQQAAVGNRARVVFGFGFPPKRKRQRLSGFAAGKVKTAVPGQAHHGAQQQGKRNPRSQGCIEAERGEQTNEGRAQPIRQ
jgi:hypothetical protein